MFRSVTVVCAALAWPAWAGEFAPGGNGGALARSFALPALGNPGVLPRDHAETGLTLDITNEYVNEGSCAAECVTLDGETTRLRLSHRRGLGGGWDFSFELPLLERGGRLFDGWIQDWHDWFGLPTAGREQVDNGRYRFHYERAGVVLLDETQGGSGLGDAALAVGRGLGRLSVLRAMVKLPTGDAEALGGGNAGGALWLEQALPLPRGWGAYLALGASVNERGAVLPDLQNRGIVFGGIGLLAPLTPAVRLTAQLQGHSRL